MYHQYCIQILM